MTFSGADLIGTKNQFNYKLIINPMEFKEDRVDMHECKAKTDKGFTLKYMIVNSSDIVYHNPKFSGDEMDDVDADGDVGSRPTLFDIECDFIVTCAMVDRLQSSKIIYIKGFSVNKELGKSHIKFEAKQMFSYAMLKDILCDMCIQFSLQSPLSVDESIDDK